MPEEIVDVVFFGAIGMGCIWRDGVNGKFTIDVVDYVWRVVDVPHARGGNGSGTVIWRSARCLGSRIRR